MTKSVPGLDAELLHLPPSPAVELERGVRPIALVTLARLALERLIRGRRLLLLVLLYLLPVGLALLVRYEEPDYQPVLMERNLIFYLIPQALLPLTALVLATGMVQDEVEEQTLTYLLMRPVPRWAIYLAKLLASTVLTAGLVAVFTTATLLVVHVGTDGFSWSESLRRAGQISGLMALAGMTYTALFGLASLILRRSLVVGVAYIVLFEGVFANIDFMLRRGTVMFHVRLLCARWLGIEVPEWSIDLATAPQARTSLLVLVLATLVSAVLAAVVFTYREFRVKTPEGN